MSYGKKSILVSEKKLPLKFIQLFIISSNFPLYFNEHVSSLNFTINIKLILLTATAVLVITIVAVMVGCLIMTLGLLLWKW